METNEIIVHHATENNLKYVSIRIPKHQITVFTGVSGSGKSSLVLDTLAAQSRRELNDTFPSFVQQYLPKYGRPHVERIENLPAAIVINQKKPSPNQRSTVGTYTDTYTLLRLLFSRVGQPFVGYSDSFSFNHPQGCCLRCNGLGEVTDLDVHKLVDFDKCLNDDGVIHYVAFEPGQWRWIRYANSGLFDLNKKIKDYSEEELELFLYSPQIRLKNPPEGWPKTAKYEGLVHRMYRSVLNSEEGKLHRELLDPITSHGVCPECNGARLNQKVLSCKIDGKNIADVIKLPLSELRAWIAQIEDPLAKDIQDTLHTKLSALIDIGLGYLSLDRGLSTLSGGEIERCKIAKCLNSSLSELLYILDEPSAGLEGSYKELLESDTPTGEEMRLTTSLKAKAREAKGIWRMEHIHLHNLKDITIEFPIGNLVVIAGVAGSGKSSLMESFYRSMGEDVVFVSQRAAGASLRSTPATYLGVADEIRKIFAKRCGQKASLFSFNGAGKCPACKGKGVIVSDMAFMDDIETTCDVCKGLRYSKEVLQYEVDGKNIAEVMDLTVAQAGEFFRGTKISEALEPLEKVGLSYLHLNQALSTLSGGELQRMKFASYLGSKDRSFILDEQTNGLHIKNVRSLLKLLNQMVDEGNSIFVIEHNIEFIKSADYVVELGPEGGDAGGRLLFAGTPSEMKMSEKSVTAEYL